MLLDKVSSSFVKIKLKTLLTLGLLGLNKARRIQMIDPQGFSTLKKSPTYGFFLSDDFV
jgi:hypothetical protein